MTEKTPRKLGEEAKNLYGEHKDIEASLTEATLSVAVHKSDVRFHNGMLAALEDGKRSYYLGGRGGNLDSTDMRYESEMVDDLLKGLGDAVMDEGFSLDQSDKHMKQAARHYRRNNVNYHTLAVAEAALDGIHINVQQPESLAEPIEVQVS